MSFQLIADLSNLAHKYPTYSEDIKKLMITVLNKTDDDEETGQGATLLGPKPLEPADAKDEGLSLRNLRNKRELVS